MDLHGRMVTPGLSDGHFHNEGGGHGIDLSPTRSVADLLAEVGAAGKKAQPSCVSKCFAIVGPSSQDGGVWRTIPFREDETLIFSTFRCIPPPNALVRRFLPS